MSDQFTAVEDEDDDITLINTQQVAEYCAVSTDTVRKWIDSKVLPAIKLDNVWRIRKTDLRNFLRKRYHA